MTRVCRECTGWIAALCLFGLCGILGLSAAAAAPGHVTAKDPLEPARAALRTLQFAKAIELLSAAGSAGNPNARYLLGLVYLNGVGVAADPARARALLQSAAEHGQGAAAYVLAAELANEPDAPPGAAQSWLECSAKLGYIRAAETLRSGRPLLARESVGASDPALLSAWVIDRVRKNDAAELRRIGPTSAGVHDEFGRAALAYAAAADTLAAATALLDMGAQVNAGDKAGTTALMIAAERPDAAMVDLLLLHGADPQAADAERRTALFYAARANRPAIIERLQRANVLLDARDDRGYNALEAALAAGAAAAAEELRSLGMHTDLVAVGGERQSGRFDPAHPGDIYRGWPPLALAVSRNDTAAVKQLLDAGANANLRIPPGDTLLQVAADAHAMDALPLLLAHGADPIAADHAGHGVLWHAAVRNDVSVLKALLSAGVSPDAHAAGERTPLLAALRATHPDAAQMLLAAGANPEATDAQGRTPLMLACAVGQAALARGLLAHHARIDAQDHAQRTALWYAAAAGSRDEVDALLAAGASPKVNDDLGLTVLHAAAAQQDAAVLERLLGADAPINQRSTGGDTAAADRRVAGACRGGQGTARALAGPRRPEQSRRYGLDRGQPRGLHRHLPSADGGGSQQGIAQRCRRLCGRYRLGARIRGDCQGNRAHRADRSSAAVQ